MKKTHGEHKIGRRLALYILLFSSLITLVFTVFQLLWDYKIEVGSINSRIEQIGISNQPSISIALWFVDLNAVSTQLQGLSKLPDIQFLEVTDPKNKIVSSVGTRLQDNTIERRFPLYHEHRGKTLPLGELHVQANLTNVYQRMEEKVIIILLSQGIKTFMVSLFILLLVHRLVTHHLATIARQAANVSPKEEPQPFTLDRTHSSWTENDELDKVVTAITIMQKKLWLAYEEISHHKDDLEQQVEKRTHELAAINTELSSFCYSVSHDLRGPLRTIHGFSEIVVEDYADKLGPDGRGHLDRVKGAAIRMGELIDDLLNLSRVTQTPLKLEDIDVSAVCTEICNNLAACDQARHVEWEVQSGMTTKGDPGLIKIAFANLIGNAWKYTRDSDTPQITCGQSNLSGNIVFYVKDNGCGFDMQYCDQLFKVFHRLHSHQEYEGTGIGLATVERIAHRHHGMVWAEGEVGKGATFYLKLAVIS